jgi:hypothetical protein
MFMKRPPCPVELKDVACDTIAAVNVVLLHPRITQRQTALLARWLEAGRRMGLCDACACFPKRGERERDYVLVWVRENPDPAYLIEAIGTEWSVRDAVRDRELARQPNFVAALNFIRPVLPLEAAA